MINIKKWERMLEQFMEQTKSIVYNLDDPDRYIPTALLANNDDVTLAVLTGMDKYDVYTVVTNMAFQNQTECIAVCMNTWIVQAYGEEDFEVNEDGDKEYVGPIPSQHPNKREALNLWASYGAKQMQLTVPYDRQSSGKVKNFLEEIRFDFDDEEMTLENYLWLDALAAMRDKDFKP